MLRGIYYTTTLLRYHAISAGITRSETERSEVRSSLTDSLRALVRNAKRPKLWEMMPDYTVLTLESISASTSVIGIDRVQQPAAAAFEATVPRHTPMSGLGRFPAVA